MEHSNDPDQYREKRKDVKVNEQFTFRVTPEQYIWVKQAAERWERSIGDIMRELVDHAMEQGK